jgi:thiol-disulfide isomerase/thioredoxin
MADEVVLDLPASLTRTLQRRTLLVYFSPSCPHCQDVAPELNALSARLGDRVEVVGISSGSQDEAAMTAFVRDYAVPFRVVHDADHAIGSAMGVRSTPSAVLVEPQRSGALVLDAWYPYRRGFDTLVEMRAAEAPWSVFDPGEFHGNATCAACHAQEMESWELTHHAIAWRTLVASEKTGDPSCTGCHVTGDGQPGGWAGEADSALVDVGCEACHGPGGPHDGASLDARTTCAACHDAEHAIAFSVDKGLPLIDHFRSAAMDDAAFTEARRLLASGDAPRHLLAFGEGETAGQAACVACHAAPHARWADSAHARAMNVLPTADAKNPECVRCHATAVASGPPATALDGYRTDEGVGCEACHGPGEAHVSAGGGADNIVGLGDSCPVCVIEAVCTGCHTSQWDPDWNLERDLPLVAH